jgi:hypothetical protein
MPSYGEKATADCHILELNKFQEVIFRRQKNAGESISFDKANSKIFKPLKMVLCSSWDGVPLKLKKKGGSSHGSNEPSLDHSQNSLDNTFKLAWCSQVVPEGFRLTAVSSRCLHCRRIYIMQQEEDLN